VDSFYDQIQKKIHKDGQMTEGQKQKQAYTKMDNGSLMTETICNKDYSLHSWHLP